MTETFSIDVDEPKLARDLRRKMSRRLRLNLRDTTPARLIVRWLWPFVADAYSAGYRAGHEDQMQMRIRDAMEASEVRRPTERKDA